MKNALYFLGGLAIGAVGGYFVAKKVYEKQKEEEVQSVIRAFKEERGETCQNPDPENSPSDENEETKPTGMFDPLMNRPKRIDIPPIDYTSYANKVSEYSPADSAAMVAKMRSDVERSRIAAAYNRDVTIISRQEFQENEDEYEIEMFTYFADEQVADSDNDIVDGWEKFLGIDFTDHFEDDKIDPNKYDPDVVYIRNDKYEVMYEVVRDLRRFEDVAQGKA